MTTVSTKNAENMRRLHASLYGMSYLTDFGAMLLLFTVSRYLAQQNMGMTVLGVLGAIFATSHAASAFISGRLSDRIGRSRCVLGGAVLLLIGLAVTRMGLGHMPGMMVGYILGGTGMGAVYAPLIGWLNDGDRSHLQTRGISRTTILFCLSWNMGLMSGQGAGGFLFAIDPLWALTAGLAVAGINTLVLLLRGPQPVHATLDDHQHALQAAHLSRARRFATIGWMANLGSAFSMTTVMHLFPQLAVALGIASELHGTLLMLMRIMMIATFLFMYRVRFWQFRMSTAAATQAIGLLGVILLISGVHVAILTVGLGCVAILGGYNYFASLFYNTTSRDDAGKGAGGAMHEATLGIGFAAGSLLGGLLGGTLGVRAPFVLAGVMLILTSAAQVWLYFRKKPVGVH